jgi:excisionase family DNA binding protein
MMRPTCNASWRTPMPLTLAEAAQATGLNRSTILRAIKSGRISGARDEAGAWSVEPVELHRVFPPAEAMPKAAPQDAQTDALVAELRAQLAEMRSQRDAWQGIAERLALSAPKPPEPEPKPSKRPWWRRLRG